MITSLVQFNQPITRENALQLFTHTAPKYLETSGLIRKYYLLFEDGGNGGWGLPVEIKKDAEVSTRRSG